MQTLLEKVKKIEDEAQALIESTRTNGKQAIADIVSREGKVLADVKERALQQGRAIIKEAIAKAQSEGVAIRQTEATAAKGIEEVADKNKAETLKLASQLFEQDFLN